MNIVAGSDDTAEVVQVVVSDLRRRGHAVHLLECEAWPEVAHKVARQVAEGQAAQGLLFCWTGTGTAMMANKVPGVRAALAWEPWIAEGARRWNDANVLVMSSKRVSPDLALEIVDAWLRVEGPDDDELPNILRMREIEACYRVHQAGGVI